MESDGGLDHILGRFKHEVREFKNGNDMSDDLYHALYDFYLDSGDMPYGTAKGRDGDPMEWVSNRLDRDLNSGSDLDGDDADFPAELAGSFDANELNGDDIDGSMEGDFDGVIPESESLNPELDGKEMLDEGLEGTITDILTTLGLDEGYDYFFENGLVAIGRDTAKIIVNALKNDERMLQGPYISGIDGEEVRIGFGEKEVKPSIDDKEVRGLAYEPEHELDENRFNADNPEMSYDDVQDHWQDKLSHSKDRMTGLSDLNSPDACPACKGTGGAEDGGLCWDCDGSGSSKVWSESMDGDYSDDALASEWDKPHFPKKAGEQNPFRDQEDDEYTDRRMRGGERGMDHISSGLMDGKINNKQILEGKVKELSADLKSEKSGGLSDEAFKKQYKKTKAEMRNEIKKSSKKKVEESISMSISADDADSFLADIKKLSGLVSSSEESCDTSGQASPMIAISSGQIDFDSVYEAKLPNVPKVDNINAKYFNSKDEKYYDLADQLEQGEDLNRPKKQNAKAAARGDNPLTKQFEEIENKMWNKYQKFVSESNILQKAGAKAVKNIKNKKESPEDKAKKDVGNYKKGNVRANWGDKAEQGPGTGKEKRQAGKQSTNPMQPRGPIKRRS